MPVELCILGAESLLSIEVLLTAASLHIQVLTGNNTSAKGKMGDRKSVV